MSTAKSAERRATAYRAQLKNVHAALIIIVREIIIYASCRSVNSEGHVILAAGLICHITNVSQTIDYVILLAALDLHANQHHGAIFIL